MKRFDRSEEGKYINVPLMFVSQGKNNKKDNLKKELLKKCFGKQTPKSSVPADQYGAHNV